MGCRRSRLGRLLSSCQGSGIYQEVIVLYFQGFNGFSAAGGRLWRPARIACKAGPQNCPGTAAEKCPVQPERVGAVDRACLCATKFLVAAGQSRRLQAFGQRSDLSLRQRRQGFCQAAFALANRPLSGTTNTNLLRLLRNFPRC